MRRIALAAVIGAGLSFAGVAAAEQWTDPNGRLTINTPSGWRVQPQQMAGGTAVLAFSPSSDCYFFGIPNPASATASVAAVRNTTAPLGADVWANAAQAVPSLFSSPAQVVSQSVDTSGFWPVQRAQLQGDAGVVHAVIGIRPGVELRGFCSGPDAASTYEAFLSSLGHPNDAAWQAEAAAQPAPAPAPAPQEEDED